MPELTAKQHRVLDVVTEAPLTPTMIATRAGMSPASVRDHLSALRQKGLVEKKLNPTRWRRL